MTKKLAFSASGLVLAFLASPVMAGSTHMISADPCVLGSGAETHCQGAIRVTENIEITANGPSSADAVSVGSYASSSSQYSNTAYVQSQNSVSQYSSTSGYNYNSDNHSAYQHQSHGSHLAPMEMRTGEVREMRVMREEAPQSQTCHAAVAQRVPCNGQWVVVGEAPPPMMYAPAPPPVSYAPPPPPMMYAPPQAPAYYMPPPQQFVQINPSFFYGGMNNGVGYNVMTGYGGGGAIFASGGSRFSGVRERSPTPLVPPGRRQPPPPHNPPPPPPN